MRRRNSGVPARAVLGGLVVAAFSLFSLFGLFGLLAPSASAQAVDFDAVVGSLQSKGWYIEPGAEGDAGDFAELVGRSETRSDEEWYFVSLAGPVEDAFSDELRDEVRPLGNVVVYFPDDEGFVNVQISTGSSDEIEDRALEPFDRDWDTPDEFMGEVVDEYGRLTGSASSSASSSSSSSGGVPGWIWVAVPVGLIGGGMWYSSRRSAKKRAEDQRETAEKIRAEIVAELEELANDVIVLNGPVELSENAEVITHYREATQTYTDISDEVPDLDELEGADLRSLSELGARVAHARWQMDAAEALIAGDPVPERPKVEPTPAPEPAPKTESARTESADRTSMPRSPLPQRQPRPRVPYSRSRRSSGGGLLDILIAGAGMLGRSGGALGAPRPRSGGPMFGGSRSTPRRGGGVFGSGRGSSRRSSSRSSNRTSTRSSSRRSTSRSRSSSRRRASTSRRRRR